MDRTLLRTLLEDMILARAFEERAAMEYSRGRIGGFLHLYPGEEAIATGVIRAAEPGDYLVATYREHVHALVRGIPPERIMAELFGKATGICQGMGGSMHLFDRERRFMGGYGIVGETFPVAIGLAYAIACGRLPEAVVCFFGDGAVNQGTFHESLNMAALWNLPILFVCENNLYQIGTEIRRHSAVTDVYRRASAYHIPGHQLDGMDVLAVHTAAKEALATIRSGGGPVLLECLTYRYRGHSMADPGTYRPAQEIAAWRARDPLAPLLESPSDPATAPPGNSPPRCPGPLQRPLPCVRGGRRCDPSVHPRGGQEPNGGRRRLCRDEPRAHDGAAPRDLRTAGPPLAGRGTVRRRPLPFDLAGDQPGPR